MQHIKSIWNVCCQTDVGFSSVFCKFNLFIFMNDFLPTLAVYPGLDWVTAAAVRVADWGSAWEYFALGTRETFLEETTLCQWY